jgi:hypothetical protein
VAILEGKDLQNRVREDVGDAHDDPRPPAIIEPVRFDLALEVVPRDELRTAHVECAETRPHALLGPKDLPCIDLSVSQRNSRMTVTPSTYLFHRNECSALNFAFFRLFSSVRYASGRRWCARSRRTAWSASASSSPSANGTTAARRPRYSTPSC